MSAEPSLDLWAVFARRPMPTQWLREGLDAIDRRFGEEFIAATKSGASAEDYFLGAVPYLTFLTPEAAVYFLPAFFRSALQASIQLYDLDRYFCTETGHLTLSLLSREEQEAIEAFLSSFPGKEHTSAVLERLHIRRPSNQNA
jgi:hypothetical protein